MKRKGTVATLLAVVLVLILAVTAFAQGNGQGAGTGTAGAGQCTEFIDADGDGLCDSFVDADGDGVNDAAPRNGSGSQFNRSANRQAELGRARFVGTRPTIS